MSIDIELDGQGQSVERIPVNPQLWNDLKKLRVDIGKAVEQGLAQALVQRKESLWLEQNREALESSNAFIERNGLPLGRYRFF